MEGMGVAQPTNGKMKKLLSNEYLALLFRLILGMVFIVASIDKIANTAAFASSIGNYKLLFPDIAMIIATVLPWVELLCGMGLLFGINWRGSALLSFLMLFIFTVMVGIAMARGLDISCGCFTQDPTVGKIGWKKVGENLLLLLSSAFIYYSTGTRFTLERIIQSRS
jgi:putative oxidoreductase